MKHIIELSDFVIVDGWNDGTSIYIGVAEYSEDIEGDVYPIGVMFVDARGYSETVTVSGSLKLTDDAADWGGLTADYVPELYDEIVAVKIILGVNK